VPRKPSGHTSVRAQSGAVSVSPKASAGTSNKPKQNPPSKPGV
jgi:hypothetical protein